jgi:hypothetical protein
MSHRAPGPSQVPPLSRPVRSPDTGGLGPCHPAGVEAPGETTPRTSGTAGTYPGTGRRDDRGSPQIHAAHGGGHGQPHRGDPRRGLPGLQGPATGAVPRGGRGDLTHRAEQGVRCWSPSKVSRARCQRTRTRLVRSSGACGAKPHRLLLYESSDTQPDTQPATPSQRPSRRSWTLSGPPGEAGLSGFGESHWPSPRKPANCPAGDCPRSVTPCSRRGRKLAVARGGATSVYKRCEVHRRLVV